MSIDTKRAAAVAEIAAFNGKIIGDKIEQFGDENIDTIMALLKQTIVEGKEEQFENRLNIVQTYGSYEAVGINILKLVKMHENIKLTLIESGKEELDAEILANIYVGLVIKDIADDEESFFNI